MYEELIKALRGCEISKPCDTCPYYDPHWPTKECATINIAAADAIEELLKAAKSMHTWIFLNSGDEQAAYDKCGLTDEMNVALGYSGQFIVEQTKGES